jgi:hypothetical protein
MNEIENQVTEKFDTFENEHNPTSIYEAMEIIETAQRNISRWDDAERNHALAHWLLFLARLDKLIDPQWDPDQPPVRGTKPPPTQGVVFSSGEVDPETISDPDQRAEYVRLLKKSKEDARLWDIQFQLRRIEERAMYSIETLLTQRFSTSPASRQAGEELLAASTVTDARRQQLRALLTKQDG